MKPFLATLLSVVLACTPVTAHADAPAPPVTHTLEDAVTDESVDAAIAALETATTRFVLHIDSPGGGVRAGMRLVKAIERSPAIVTCVVDGNAASMAFIILQACDVRVATDRSVLMMHGAAVGGLFQGQEHDWRNVAERLRVMNAALTRFECRRLRVTYEECASWTADGKEKWMTPLEALAVGALDGVAT